MSTPAEILRTMSPDRFAEVLGASPKAFREELFRRANIKVKTALHTLKSRNKNRTRSDKLLAQLGNGADLDAEMLAEIIRNYLYTRRELLADALDFFGVRHEEGLTDEDLAFIESLPPEKSRALREKLGASHAPQDVDLYFTFMRVPEA